MPPCQYVTIADEGYPPRLRQPVLGRAPKRLLYAGNQKLTSGPCVAVLSSRDIDPGSLLALRSLMSRLGEVPLTFTGGWHAPAEEECLRLMSARHSVVVCLAKGLPHYQPSDTIAAKLDEGRALIVSHCQDTVDRISRERSLRANEIAVSLSRCIFVLSGPEGTAAAEIAARALAAGVPVAALAHPANEYLHQIDAEWASREWIIQQAGLANAESEQEGNDASSHN